MSAFAFITEREDRRARYEEAIAFEGHRLANYARERYADPFERLAWAWCVAGKDADEPAAEEIRNATVEDLLSTSDHDTHRVWAAFRTTRAAESGQITLALAWRERRTAA